MRNERKTISPDDIDATGFVRFNEEISEKRDEFMRKYLRRIWPVRIVGVLGVIELLIGLAVIGVDLPIILMFAPRWELFAGVWTFICVLLASIGTLHSSKKYVRQFFDCLIIPKFSCVLLSSRNDMVKITMCCCLESIGRFCSWTHDSVRYTRLG
jgi:hypothetical protein